MGVGVVLEAEHSRVTLRGVRAQGAKTVTSALLANLSDNGVSIWPDDLSRSPLTTGSRAGLVVRDHVVGVTTNPAIFAKAIAGSDAYANQMRDLRHACWMPSRTGLLLVLCWRKDAGQPGQRRGLTALSAQRQACRIGLRLLGLHLRAGRQQDSSRRRGYARPGSSRRRISWPVTSAIRS